MTDSDPPFRHLLVLNAGSSSIKFAMFEASNSLRRVYEGELERIGLPQAILRCKNSTVADGTSRKVTAPNFAAAVDVLTELIEQHDKDHKFAAVGHRVVHGGSAYHAPERITPQMLGQLRGLSSLDSEHLPAELRLIEAVSERFPTVPQVACFDTGFHHQLPRLAQIVPIPRRYQERGVRRYGFHGLSYSYLLEKLRHIAGEKAAKGRVIMAHLGNGASMAAVKNGQSTDTTMGFTPASGLMMGTRSGDVDPGLPLYLLRGENMSPSTFDDMMNHNSGLLGISETSSDMRDLLSRQDTDVRAKEAVDLFCYSAKKWIGAYAAVLGGLDTLVFSGGIGENAASVRAGICRGLEFLGIDLDEKRNSTNADVISNDGGPVEVRVMRTDEEFMIAKSVCDVLSLIVNGKELPL